MYTVHCGVKAEDGFQVEFDTMDDFFAFEKKRKEAGEKHPIRGYLKSENLEMLFIDAELDNCFDWYVLADPKEKTVIPIRWHSVFQNYQEQERE